MSENNNKDEQLAEARAEIERLRNQLEDESMRADGMKFFAFFANKNCID